MDRSDSTVDIEYREQGWADQSWDPAQHEHPIGDGAIEHAPDMMALDERRLHVRAYNLWASLLDDRAMPAITDLDPADLKDFGPNSVLLNFDAGIENPKLVFLGQTLRQECDIAPGTSTLGAVPPRSLLSRLTDHYLQIIANSAPIGFEAEFTNQRGRDIVYRGILMPFSSNGVTIDYVYGVISWKEVVEVAVSDALNLEVQAALRSAPAPIADLGSPWDMDDAFSEEELADRLAMARDCASEATEARQRSRQALYDAIGAAYDFALAAEADAEGFAELLNDAGIQVQARAPMTGVAKLVFGANYDKTRLAEIALVLEHGRSADIAQGAMAGHIAGHPGGLKGLIAAARIGRRPDAAPEGALGRAQTALAGVEALAWDDIPLANGDIGVVVARREADGSLSLVATLDDMALASRVIRRVAVR